MKVAIVHDDLVQWGGAEKVLLGISELFPDASIYTSFFDRSNKLLADHFKDKKIITSFMQNIPFNKDLYKALFLLYPIAFEQFDFSEYDLVISQTTRAAKSIITKPKTVHICYCHTPPRYLWNFSGEKVPSFLRIILNSLRVFDKVSSSRVDYFLAGSENAKERIRKVYQRDSKVLYPFVDLDQVEKFEPFDGDYFLVIARLNNYKRVDLAVEVFRKREDRLKIVGVGPKMDELASKASSNIEFLGNVSDRALLSLIAGCKGLIVTAEEDFGLTPIEAQAFGKGVIAYRGGGALETVEDRVTGVLFDNQTINDLNSALEKFKRTRINPERCRISARKFSKQNFQRKLIEEVDSVCI